MPANRMRTLNFLDLDLRVDFTDDYLILENLKTAKLAHLERHTYPIEFKSLNILVSVG